MSLKLHTSERIGAVKTAFRNPVSTLRFAADRIPRSREELGQTVRAAQYRLASPDYLTYYKRLQDEKVQAGNAYPRNGVGTAQFQFLRKHGLEPSHRLLDIGCGDLRGGQHAIDYLESEHYTGIDISAAAIGRAVTLADSEFPEQRPRLFVNDDLRFREFDREFDVILAQSVFTHLPREYVRECLEHVDRVLAAGGVFYATFFDADHYHSVPSLRTSGSDSVRYPFGDLASMADQAGLRAERCPYPEYPTDEMDMVAFRRAE